MRGGGPEGGRRALCGRCLLCLVNTVFACNNASISARSAPARFSDVFLGTAAKRTKRSCPARTVPQQRCGDRCCCDSLPFLACRQHRRGVDGVVHCFTGSQAELEAFLEMGLHIGITGWVADDRPERGGAQLAALLPLVPGASAEGCGRHPLRAHRMLMQLACNRPVFGWLPCCCAHVPAASTFLASPARLQTTACSWRQTVRTSSPAPSRPARRARSATSPRCCRTFLTRLPPREGSCQSTLHA